MRYLLQFAIPASIVVVVVYLLVRNRRGRHPETQGADTGDVENTSDTGIFLLILIVGATVAVLSIFAVQEFWG